MIQEFNLLKYVVTPIACFPINSEIQLISKGMKYGIDDS
jgi:hypothetical protein